MSDLNGSKSEYPMPVVDNEKTLADKFTDDHTTMYC